jgi:hypothetical protein
MAETPAPPKPDDSVPSYRWTLVLFAAVAAAIVIWFQRHVEPFVTGTLIIGGTISAWGLWQLGWSFFTGAGGEGRQDLTRRFLGTRNARRALWFAALVTLLLHVFTTSTYLRFEGATVGENEFTVQAVERGKIFRGPYTLHPGDVIGYPTFPGFRTRELEFQILDRRGFLPLQKTLRPGGALDIKVPGSFARKVYHHIVLVPDGPLYSRLPRADQPGAQRLYLSLTIGGETVMLPDYLRGLVVTGTAMEDLPKVTDVQGDTLIRQEITDQYKRSGFQDQEEAIATLMSSDVARLGSAEFGPGTTFVVEVGTWQFEEGPDSRQKRFSCELTVPTDGAVHTRTIGPTVEGTCK